MTARSIASIFGTSLALLLLATPARAQVHVGVSIHTPAVRARVVLGAPRVHVVRRYYEPMDTYYEPVYAPAYRYYEPVYVPVDRGCAHREVRVVVHRDRDYYRDVRHARHEYVRDRREVRRGRRW